MALALILAGFCFWSIRRRLPWINAALGLPGRRYRRRVLSRWQGGFAALIVTLLAGALMIFDVTDAGPRRWWSGHALTTDTVSGLLVLLITVLVIDQVVRLRQINSRAHAVAAQAAIMVSQAIRSAQAVSQALAGSGDRDAASDEFRTYMMMLLVSAPVLIDATMSRNFLEQAQALAGQMARALTATARTPGQASYPTARLDDALQRLRTASTPLLQVLDPGTRAVVLGEQSAESPADHEAVYKELPGQTGAQRSHLLKAPPVSIPPARLPPVLGVTRVQGEPGG